MKKCPFCAEEIQSEAIKCKHCGEKYPLKKNTKDIWYRLIKVLYFFGYSILIGISLIGFVIAFIDEWVSIFDGLGFALGIIIGIILIEVINIILIYLFKGDIKQIDYCILKYKFKKLFIFIPFLILLGVSSIGYLGLKEYQEKIIADKAYSLGANSDEDVKRYKEILNKKGVILKHYVDNNFDPDAYFKVDMCSKIDIPDIDLSDKYVENRFTSFYDTNNGKCYLLREYNSHGGNGLIRVYLYEELGVLNSYKKEILSEENNQVSNSIYFATSNDVYINRLDDLLKDINLSKYSKTKIIATPEVLNDNLPEWNDSYNKILGLRELANYQEKKKELYEKEERLIDENFLWQHYRSLSVGMKYDNNLGKYIRDFDELRYVYNNYINPPVSYNTFFSWYKNTISVSVGKISLLEGSTYQLILTINDSIDGELKYDIRVKVKRYENGDRKIESYESVKI